MKLWHGPLGKLCKGHVLDVAVGPFQEALQFYDPQLYVKWNPKKLKGWGCWEIRRTPNTKTMVFKGVHQGNVIYSLENVENNIINHVLDCAFLNYDALRKIKEMDTWDKKHWVHDLEYIEQQHADKKREKAKEELKYQLRHHKNVVKDFYELVRSGHGPAQILTSTKWTSK